MSKPSRLPITVWLLINFSLLVGVPVWAYFELEREVYEGHRSGAITSNGDSIAIPLMGIIMGVAALALIFNVLWGISWVWLQWQRRGKPTA